MQPHPGAVLRPAADSGCGDGAEGLASDRARRDPPSRLPRTHPPLPAREASAAGAQPRTAPPLPPAPGTETSTGASGGPEALGPEMTSAEAGPQEAGSRLRGKPEEGRRKPVASR